MEELIPPEPANPAGEGEVGREISLAKYPMGKISHGHESMADTSLDQSRYRVQVS